jgi:adenosylcobinamide-GDP ribazoletransferase
VTAAEDGPARGNPLEAVALLTVLPVPRGAAAGTRGVLPWAPLVGVLLGGVATGVGVLGARLVSPTAGAVLAVAALALLTRGLHLDGLADTADGLGPLRSRERSLAVMRSGDVGPFGVAALVLVLLLQVACLATLLPRTWEAPWVAVLAARLALTAAGLPGVPVAAGSALGRAVAGTVGRSWFAGCCLVTAALAAGAGWLAAGPAGAWRLPVAAAAGLLAADLLRRRATARLGGVTGDVLGAATEAATTVALLVAAALR